MNTCRCGCGNPVGQGKQWIRGHNMRVATAPAAPARNDPDDGYDMHEDLAGRLEEEYGADVPWWEAEAAPGLLTYEDAAANIADDPEPARLPSAAVTGDPPPVTRAVLRDVQGKSLFWMLTGVELWGLVDPYCAQIAQEAAPKIAVKAAPILCGSPQIVMFFTKATTFMKWTEFFMACKPVAVAVIAHHVTRSIEIRRGPEGAAVAEQADWSQYSAA